MSDNRAYTYDVLPEGSADDEDFSVHQTSPSWVLTFISWQYRDTLRIDSSQGSTLNTANLDKLKAVRNPLVVVNDCLSVSVTCNKGSYTPNMEATLVQTDVNYLTEIAPGDFCFVNMCNWQADAERIAQAAAALSPINGFNDGFKGLFKVQSVRRTVSVNQNGAKSVIFKITGFGFTEFNNSIYFDPTVVKQNEGDFTFSKRLAESWYSLINNNASLPIQKVIRILSETFIGRGLSTENTAGSPHDSQGNLFFLPSSVGKLLGLPGVTCAKDIYNFIMGIQYYGNTNANLEYQGFNPSGLQNTSGRTWEMPSSFNCPGVTYLKAEYWNNIKTWDILSQYVNRPINEFYTCFRVDPAQNSIMPTVVFRQIPFTTEDFVLNGSSVNTNAKVTRFLTLPRWRINPGIVVSEDLGREEAARINYVQIFGKVLQNTSQGTDNTQETIRGNYVYEKNDIQRSGLKAVIVSNSFDIFSEKADKVYNSITWAKIVGDAMIGAHLRLNGTLICFGIIDPITIGDNVEWDNVVYHIEQVSHTCSIDPGSGNKNFRTVISLSQGMSLSSSAQYGSIYPQMSNPNAYAERVADYSNNQILPGISESQDTDSRPSLDKPKGKPTTPNNPYPQPKEIKTFLSKPVVKKKK